MNERPEDPSAELERVVKAISDGEPVEWEKEAGLGDVDPKTLEALRLIDTVSRLHRSGGSQSEPAAAGAEPEGSGSESTWGGLRIRGPLGAGVYGEVYRAFDPRLRQEVALKLWGSTKQPRTVEQLLEEARRLARIRHPNVLLVLGADVHDGRVGMWTELLEGVTFEHLLTNLGPAHWRETAGYAIDLCRALSAVHAVGLVHCDVKAANVMRERGGRIVLMDFGSADAYPASGSDGALPGAGPSPGGIEGTPLAMAPEVLRKERATPASDLFSLGVLLFRLVSGRYPVQAETLEELRQALERGPLPSLRSVRPNVPAEFAEVVARALERDPSRRFASAIEMERALAAALTSVWLAPSAPAPDASRDEAARPKPGGRARVWAAAAVVLAAILVGGVLWFRRSQPPNASVPLQFTLRLPPHEHLKQFANVVVSPDGTRIAFASIDSTGRSALWVRRFDSLTSVRIPGTENAWYPFWSPDSRQLAYFGNGVLSRVGIDGDSVRTVCRVEMGRGGTWNRQGTILFAPSLEGPLMRVPAEGGNPVPATELEAGSSEVGHRWPCFLPDGEHFLYVTTPETRGTFALYVGTLRSDRRVYVGQVESGAVYTSGMLVYTSNQALEARPFDVRTLRWSGEPRPVSAIPGYGGSVAEPHASASENGTMVYSFQAARESRLVWIDTQRGSERTLTVGPYFDPRISPDGSRIAAERVEGSGRSSVWMIDAQTGGAERWTEAPGLNRKPIWSPAGDSILYSSNRSGRYQLLVRGTVGTPRERSVYAPAEGLLMWPNDWGRDGMVTFDRFEPGASYNIYELRAGAAVPLVCTRAREGRSALSPDGHWIAFESNGPRGTRVVVRDRRAQEQFEMPTEGVVQPMWARDTGQLFYRTTANEFFVATPVAGKRPGEWPIRRLFRTGVLEGYDVDARGERLLCCVKTDIGQQEEVAVLVNLPAAVAKGF
jgi:serine/threonine-protein kinase